MGPGHVIGAFVAGAGLTAGTTLWAGSRLRDNPRDVSVLYVGIGAVAAVSAGIMYGARAVRAGDAMKGAAIFAAGIGSGMGYQFALPAAVGMPRMPAAG